MRIKVSHKGKAERVDVKQCEHIDTKWVEVVLDPPQQDVPNLIKTREVEECRVCGAILPYRGFVAEDDRDIWEED